MPFPHPPPPFLSYACPDDASLFPSRVRKKLPFHSASARTKKAHGRAADSKFSQGLRSALLTAKRGVKRGETKEKNRKKTKKKTRKSSRTL